MTTSTTTIGWADGWAWGLSLLVSSVAMHAVVLAVIAMSLREIFIFAAGTGQLPKRQVIFLAGIIAVASLLRPAQSPFTSALWRTLLTLRERFLCA